MLILICSSQSSCWNVPRSLLKLTLYHDGQCLLRDLGVSEISVCAGRSLERSSLVFNDSFPSQGRYTYRYLTVVISDPLKPSSLSNNPFQYHDRSPCYMTSWLAW